MKCPKCGIHGITYGRDGLCGQCYMEYRRHQDELFEQRLAATKARHPSGKYPPKRRIHRLFCTCTSPTIPCSIHRDDEVFA